MSSDEITELDLCSAWTQLPRTLTLRTVDGRQVEIVHLGTWTHGLGPDFRNAMICFDGADFQTGSVELHLRSRGWTEHGHHLDPRYNDVILHVVTHDAPGETRRQDGKLVPVMVLGAEAHHVAHRTEDWSLVGGEVCARQLAMQSPSLVISALERLGDERMSARAARLEANLTRVPPDQVLYEAVLDALGYASNRAAVGMVAERLPWTVVAANLERARNPFETAAAALLGIAGFLPMSDAEFGHTALAADRLAALTEHWRELAIRLMVAPLSSTEWQMARVRPSNHPVRRLVQAAALAAYGRAGLSAALLELIRADVDPTMHLIEIVAMSGAPPLGEDRARAIAINVLIPFAFALASHADDTHLAESVAAVWGSMKPGESNERTRRAIRQISGDIGLKRLGGRAHQGLIHLDQVLCAPRRCYQCPIGQLVVSSPSKPT